MKAKIARYVLIFSAVLLIAYSAMVIVDPSIITHNLEQYANVELENLDHKYDRMVDWIFKAMQNLGWFNIIAGLVGFIAIIKSFTMREPWILSVIFISIIIGYASPVTFDLRTGIIRWMEVIELVSFVGTLIAFIILFLDFRKQALS